MHKILCLALLAFCTSNLHAGNDGSGKDSNSGSSSPQLIIQSETTNLVAVIPENTDCPVVINEFMASNSTTAQDENGGYADWIELYNNSNEEYDISGFFLTDDEAKPTKWTFPSGSKIPANGYLIVWADEDQEDGIYHCNFKLSATGEILMLLDKNQALVDSVSWGTQETDKSYARVPNGTGNFIITDASFNKSNPAPSGIAELSDNSSIHVYPNPAQNEIKVLTGNFPPNSLCRLVNMHGEILCEKEIISSETVIDIRSLAAGAYTVQVGQKHFMFIKK